jgi:proline iminopeptidase
LPGVFNVIERRLRDQLYPPIEPYQTGVLALDAVHSMYWEQSGHPGGLPVLFLHGGPGAGATAVHRRFFDPSTYRIIVYDQRGAGRSTPCGELTDNTTADLIADIERLRDHLGIKQFLLFGGSWGSTLALAYAEAYPDQCMGLVIRGIFLGRPSEIDWFLYGMKSVFPEAWRDLVAILPENEIKDILGSFHRRLLDPDPQIHLPAARAWSRYEGACSTLQPSPETVAAFGEDDMAYALARIETHYFTNSNFMSDNALLDNLDAIRHLPCVIIQGRYDMICPIATADELHRAWPGSEMKIVPDAGHSAMDPGVREALVMTTERCKERFSA